MLEFFDPNFFLAREFPILTPTHPADWPKLDSCHNAELGSAAENVSGENLGRISVDRRLAENVSPYAPPIGRASVDSQLAEKVSPGSLGRKYPGLRTQKTPLSRGGFKVKPRLPCLGALHRMPPQLPVRGLALGQQEAGLPTFLWGSAE